MGCVLTAVTMMGFFQETSEDGVALDETKDLDKSTWMIIKITLIGMSAALCFSIEAIFIKWLVVRKVDGAPGGYLTLFFDGLYGVIMLAVLAAMGDGMQMRDSGDIITTIIAGTCTSLAIVLVNYGVANGIAGISFSCANSFPAWHAIFNWIVLGQLLSTGQFLGVLLAVTGGVIISIHEFLLGCFSSDKKQG